MQRMQREQMLDKIKDCKIAKLQKKSRGHNECIGSKNAKVAKNAKNVKKIKRLQ